MINEFRSLCQSKNVKYADLRIVRTHDRGLSWKNTSPEEVSDSTDEGFGIRVALGDNWGFCASNILTKTAVRSAFQEAVSIAKSGYANIPLELGKYPVHSGVYASTVKFDPFLTPISDLLPELEQICRQISRVKGVSIARSEMYFRKRNHTFVSSEGSHIEQDILESGAGMYAVAVGRHDVQVRSYPNSHSGNSATAGLEFIRSLNLCDHAQQTGEEAVALLTARSCPSTTTNLLIGASQLALQVHESLGHSTELDRLFNMELSLAGSSFLDVAKLGRYRIGSELVNVVADARIKGALGSFGFDDEGVRARRVDLVKKGILTGYQSSRQTSSLIGGTSSGAMRADGWKNPPLIRMTNVNLLPGKCSMDELLDVVGNGIMLDTNRSWSIDDKRLNFQFATEIAWEIKRGRKGQILKNANYTGQTPRFWSACKAIGQPELWSMWGLNNCGKGEPMQDAHVGHGAAPAVFSKIQVGSGRNV